MRTSFMLQRNDTARHVQHMLGLASLMRLLVLTATDFSVSTKARNCPQQLLSSYEYRGAFHPLPTQAFLTEMIHLPRSPTQEAAGCQTDRADPQARLRPSAGARAGPA